MDEYLRKMCSGVTLHSPKEGFFKHYVEQIDAQVSEDFLNKFGKLRSDGERLLTTWGVKVGHTRCWPGCSRLLTYHLQNVLQL